MSDRAKTINSKYHEFLFQVGLHVLLFLFYSFDRNDPTINEFKVVAFLSYSLGAAIINYSLLHRFFYKKKYVEFFLFVILIVALIIAFEELILEQIYYPTTRGASFPGVFYSLLDVMPVITILAGFKFAWDASIKHREVNALRSLVEESELLYLKSQINPHFLFNNLNNLYSYALIQSPKTPSIILELSAVLRYMLYDCKERYVPLSKEIEHLKNFTLLNELQIEDRGKVSFESTNENLSYYIAPLILSVFIENAFKHSTASQSKGILIDIKLALERDGLLVFTCKNSFADNTNTSNLSKGIGLTNVIKRLHLLYPNKHELKIESHQNMYSVFLTIQLNRE